MGETAEMSRVQREALFKCPLREGIDEACARNPPPKGVSFPYQYLRSQVQKYITRPNESASTYEETKMYSEIRYF